MIEHTRRTVTLMGGAIALTFVLGVAAAAGVVPGRGTDRSDESSTEVASGVSQDAAPAAAEAAPDTTSAPATTTPPTSAPARAAKRAATPAATSSAPTAAAPTPTVSTLPPRRNPSGAEVLAAMQVLRQRIPLLPLSESFGRQFGDQVCTAFDQGSSYAQVHAVSMAEANRIPLVTVSAADVDYAIRTAVQLFCPGHQARLP